MTKGVHSMRKVTFVGDGVHELPTLGVVVKNGDVIDVPDDFNNALFSDVVQSKKLTSEKSSPSPKESAE